MEPEDFYNLMTAALLLVKILAHLALFFAFVALFSGDYFDFICGLAIYGSGEALRKFMHNRL